MYDARCLVIADRRRPATAAKKACDLGGVLDKVPALVAHIHLDQYVAWEELALRAHLRTAPDLDHLFRRDENLLKLVGQALLFGLLADGRRDLLLKARINVDHVPAATHLAMSRL